MHFDGILVLGILAHLSLAFPVVLDAAGIQVQQWVVSGVQPVLVRVLVNGVPYTGATPEVNEIFQVMSADSISLSLLANQTAVLGNHTVLRSRDCILQGPELYWRDRVFCNESLYLSLDHGGAWIAHTRQATALKAAWVQALASSAKEGIFLQETCVDLMEKLKLSEKRSGFAMPNFLIPILSLLAFSGLMGLSLLLSKQHGLRHPGGVLGSIIHYPKDMADFHPEKKGNTWQTF
ncbi:uncharacterized protein LOC127616480 [Hippocampus zosterae]|uniref:uncharacterized protein LOC127616480 n=1 Tax=Hippocampus zosterae TaxID=109293 RepID=UPI00223DB972|nr:uncharacterized protein LOC127616480 [Hippocampus zosterae]